MTEFAARWLTQLDRRDQLLLARWALPERHRPVARRLWIGITQLGGSVMTIAIAALFALIGPTARSGRWLPAAALAISHLVVQAVKRAVQRDRPVNAPVIPCPDRFSFPSGHATASLAIALSLGLLFPGAALPLLLLGALIGWSRVVLRVHYPGDVLAGQCIAIVTVLVLSAVW